MDFGRVLQKANTAWFNSGRSIKDHLGDVTEMILRIRQLEAKRRNVKWVGVTRLSLGTSLRDVGSPQTCGLTKTRWFGTLEVQR